MSQKNQKRKRKEEKSKPNTNQNNQRNNFKENQPLSPENQVLLGQAIQYGVNGIKFNDENKFDEAIIEYTKALKSFEKITQQNNDDVKNNIITTYYNRGNAHDDKREYDKAIRSYNKAIELNPNYTDAYNNRGNAYAKKGEYDTAIRDYDKIINELNPNNAIACNNRANAYLGKKEYDNAIKDYNKAIELNPNYTDAYINRGITYSNKGEYDNAIKDYDKIINELSPNNIKAYYGRGSAYYKKEEYNNAIKDYSKIINDLDSNYADAYNNRGNAYAKKGEYDTAIKDYNKIINELNPSDADAYNNRGGAFYSKGEYDTAIKDYDKIINELDLNHSNAYHNRGVIHSAKKEYDNAIKDYSKAIELNPNNANTYNNRGSAYYKKREYGNAIKDYDKAIELNPNYTNAYNNRGNAYSAKGEYDNAIKDFNKIINELNPNDAIAINNRILLNLKHDKLIEKKSEVFDDIEKLFNIVNDNNNDDDIIFYTWKYFKVIYNEQHKEFLLNIFKIISFLQVEYTDINKYMGQVTFNKIFKKNKEGKQEFSTLKINSASSMNDANEGKIILEYLTNIKNNSDDFSNPNSNIFISSFTENPADSIGMWNSQYGDICKGISYTFNIDQNIINSSLSSTLIKEYGNSIATENMATKNIGGQLQYCRVAYYNSMSKTGCKFSVFKFDEDSQTIIKQDELSKEISKLFVNIKLYVNHLSQSKEHIEFLQDSLVLVSHLVKDISYYHENEIRLINIIKGEDDKIGRYDDTNIVYFDTGHRISPKSVTLSPYLSKDTRNRDNYRYVFNYKADVRLSKHPYNFDVPKQHEPNMAEQLHNVLQSFAQNKANTDNNK